MSTVSSIDLPAPRPALLRSPTMFLCCVGVVLPNALSIAALIAGIGVPPRTTAIIAYATLAVAARFSPPRFVVPLYVLIAIYDAASTIALLFGLATSDVVAALRFASELRFFQSPFYVSLGFAAVALAGANAFLLAGRRERLRQGQPLVMMLLAAAVAAADLFTNTSAHYDYGRFFAAGKPMESAASASGFRQAALSAEHRNVLLIVVESLGHLADPAQQSMLMSPLNDPELNKRYDVHTGSTTYYGSTTAAEMRELCNTREPYQGLLEGLRLVCMPELMAARGYRTISLHNFGRKFFDREYWYPKIGFQRMIFADDLIGSVKRSCGGPFRGPCDVDMIPTIASELRQTDKPTFFYWMTLSTHVPIAPHEGTPRLNCEHDGGRLGQEEVCYMTEMWIDLLQAVITMAARLPPAEILLVGDHAPPLWSKQGRHLFTPGQVSWVRLTPRGASQH